MNSHSCSHSCIQENKTIRKRIMCELYKQIYHNKIHILLPE